MINKITHTSYNSIISFSKTQKVEEQKTTKPQKPETDKFVSATKVEPPVVDNSQTKGFNVKLTDKQIAQINAAKKLPDNLKFVYISGWHELRMPYYLIEKDDPYIKLDENHTYKIQKEGRKTLPQGYMLIRTSQGKIEAVEVIIEEPKK